MFRTLHNSPRKLNQEISQDSEPSMFPLACEKMPKDAHKCSDETCYKRVQELELEFFERLESGVG